MLTSCVCEVPQGMNMFHSVLYSWKVGGMQVLSAQLMCVCVCEVPQDMNMFRSVLYSWRGGRNVSVHIKPCVCVCAQFESQESQSVDLIMASLEYLCYCLRSRGRRNLLKLD